MVGKINWHSRGYIKREVTNKKNERMTKYRRKERREEGRIVQEKGERNP